MYLQNMLKSGVVVKVIEHKTCVETENLSKQISSSRLTDEKYQNSVVLIFMGIRKSIERG